MRKLIFGILFFAACSPGKKQTAAADTIFIYREKTKDYYYKVYIDPNKQSADRQHLLDFKFDKEEQKEITEDYVNIKREFRSPLKKYDLSNLPREWLPLVLYKGKYYIYYPSDYGYTGRTTITDTMMIYRGFEIIQKPLIAVNKINDRKYHITLARRYLDKTAPQLNIYIIDDKKKVAVWEDLSQPMASRYGLYVARDGAANFDIVVNRCEQNKVPEYQFDKVDYAKLIKRK